MQVLLQIGLVALGSACGGLARWGVTLLAGRLWGTALPFGTFLVNISGCVFLGWLATAMVERAAPGDSGWIRPDHLRLAIAVGFAGAYTTFSTFEWESDKLLRGGESLAATTYLIGSVVIGLLAVRFGAYLARVL